MSNTVQMVLAITYLFIGIFVAALVTEEDDRDGWAVVLVIIWPIVLLFLAIAYLMVGTVVLADWIKQRVRAQKVTK